MIAKNFSRSSFPLSFILVIFLSSVQAYADENTVRTMTEERVGKPFETLIATDFDRSYLDDKFLYYSEYWSLALSLTESGIFEEYYQMELNAAEADIEAQSIINCGGKALYLYYIPRTTNIQKFRFTNEFATDFSDSSASSNFISVSLGVVESLVITDISPGDGRACDWWVTSRLWFIDGGTRTAVAINSYTGMNGFLEESCYIEGQNGTEFVWGQMVFP